VTINKDIVLSKLKIFIITLLTNLPFLGAAGTILAGDSLALTYSSPGGGAALFAAIEKGYFKEDGLEVVPLRADIDAFKEYIDKGVVAGGEVNYQIYKIADGKIGITAGLYSGFLELVGRDPKGLSDIVVASENKGSGAAVAAARQLRNIGVDPEKLIWTEAPLNELERITETGDATLFARFELKRTDKKPGGGHGSGYEPGHGAEHGAGRSGASHGALEDKAREGKEVKPSQNAREEDKGNAGGIKVLYSASANLPHDDGSGPNANPHAKHTAADHFFESFTALSRDFYSKDPAKAAAITRNYIRGAIWVGENIEEAAEIGIKNGIWSGDKESLEEELKRYMWMPGVKHAKEHLKIYIHEWIARGLFPKGTNENELFDKIFIQALPDLN
jgi:ABC-type nitrate/sulfonate/bicarbonate transport system substrate-binding protein